jgi:hypothetical protein
MSTTVSKQDVFWKSTPHEAGMRWANDVGIMGIVAYPMGYIGRFLCTINCFFLLLVLGHNSFYRMNMHRFFYTPFLTPLL